jgi:hypothetical protein
MSGRIAQCPACGATVQFKWSSAVQAACAYCKAILVRHDVNLERVGEVADLPPDASPVQIGTEGLVDGKRFLVVGRIRYEWEQGNWNEWHVIFADDSSAWLSDAQSEYAVSRLVQPGAPLPPHEKMNPGVFLALSGARYMVMHRTVARYVGFEGELPFTTTDRSDCLFIDLRTEDGRFATVDYSEDPPFLFAGRFVEFEELRMRNLREFEGW